MFLTNQYQIAYSDAGVDPIDFPEAPAFAIPAALERAGLKLDDIAQFEINEAFSVVVRIAEKVLGVDSSKINVNGCVALANPITSTYLGIIAVLLLLDTLSATRVRVSLSP